MVMMVDVLYICLILFRNMFFNSGARARFMKQLRCNETLHTGCLCYGFYCVPCSLSVGNQGMEM